MPVDPSVVASAIKALTTAVSIIQRELPRDTARRLAIEQSQLDGALQTHLRAATNWCSTVQVRDMEQPLEDVLVSLQVFRGEDRRKKHTAEATSPLELLSGGRSCVVLGGPGAGKTTTLKQIAAHLLFSPPESASDRAAFPLVVRLRDLDRRESVTSHIMTLLGIRVDFDPPLPSVPVESQDDREVVQLRSFLSRSRERILAEILSVLEPAVLLDGLDESHIDDIPSICHELGRLIATTTNVVFIVTCRHGAYTTSIPGCLSYGINQFTNSQFQDFCLRWFKVAAKADEFIRCLESKPYRDLARIPLHASNLCMIYDSYADLPEVHTRIYEKIVDIRVREWDRERGITRPSSHKSFGPEEKRRFLSNASFELAKLDQGLSFGITRFEGVFKRICSRFQLCDIPAREVLAETEAHTGLIYLCEFDKYEFLHKTLQEYLCGEHLSRMPVISEYQSFLRSMPDACALATILSNDPDCFVFSLWSGLFGDTTGYDLNASSSFWLQYFGRLVAESATFAGDKLLGLGLLSILTQNCDRLLSRMSEGSSPAREYDALSGRLVDSVRALSQLTGVRASIQTLLPRGVLSSPAMAGSLGGARWRTLNFTRSDGVSDSFGRYQYPKRLVVPEFLI